MNQEIKDNIMNSETEYEIEYIYPGLILKGDYILLDNIGSGNNGSVWLSYTILSKKYYALKIQGDEGFKDGCKEITICRKIKNYMDKNPENFHCIKIIDYFIYDVKDSNGESIKYVCSVYELYAVSIGDLLNKGKHKYGFSMNIVKEILRKIVSTINILHKHINIVHTDIKPDNIMIQGVNNSYLEIINFFENSQFTEKYNQLLTTTTKHSEEYTESLNDIIFELVNNFNQLRIKEKEGINEGENDTSDSDNDSDYVYHESKDDSDVDIEIPILNKRRQSVDDTMDILNNTTMHNLDLLYDFTDILNNRANSKDTDSLIDDKDILNCQIALIDFGNAYFINELTTDEIQARKYRAPEVILDLKYDYTCDIWSIGCLAFELATGFSLFDIYNDIEIYPDLDSKPISADIHHLYLMEKMLGKIPKEMKIQSIRNKFLFDKDTLEIKNVLPFKNVSIKERLVTQFLLSNEDAAELSDFISECLIYDPKKRITAEDLLKHKFIN